MRKAGALLAFAIGHEHGHQGTPGARDGRDVVVAIALDELAALAAQLAAGDEPGRDLPRTRQHALAFQRVAKVGERLRVAAQLLAQRVAAGRVERHGDIVGAAGFEDHLAEHVERAPHLLVVMDLGKARQDGKYRSALGFEHALAGGDEAVHRPPDGDEQQAEIDEDGDAERDVVALRQADGLVAEARARRPGCRSTARPSVVARATRRPRAAA